MQYKFMWLVLDSHKIRTSVALIWVFYRYSNLPILTSKHWPMSLADPSIFMTLRNVLHVDDMCLEH